VKGFTTIHAGSARQALSRLRFICQLADTSNELSVASLNSLVSESIDVVVHCARVAEGPRVSCIGCVEDSQGGPESTQFTMTEAFVRDADADRLRWTGLLPVRAGASMAACGISVRDLLNDSSHLSP